MYGLLLDAERCPDGVELVDYGSTAKRRGPTLGHGETPTGKWFRYRTTRRTPINLEIPDLEHPVVVAFINAHDDDARADFLSRFGLTTRVPEIPHDNILDWQREFRTLLKRSGSGKPADSIQAANAALTSYKDLNLLNLQPSFDLGGDKGSPRILFRTKVLLSFMAMETAMVAMNGARFASCQHCDAAFLTGPLTWRRSHAHYCSDRCRVAAMRVRNAKRNKR